MGNSCQQCNDSKSMSCSIDSINKQESEGTFEKYFWYFIVISAIFLFFSFYFEISFKVIIVSQIFSLISVALSSKGVIKSAGREIIKKKLNANALMVIAMIGAFIIQKGQEGATAILLYSIAEKLEHITSDKSREAISKLIELAPDKALLKTKDGIREILASEVKLNEIIVLKPGMKAPLDGVIFSGSSYFNQSALTGESIPVLKEKGDKIYASSINGDGYIEMWVTRTSGNTILAKIVENIETARLNKSNTERFIEKFANYYTPIILLISVLIMVFPIIFSIGQPIDWVYRGIILLVISCPCALTLSTPLAMVAALTKLSREGILVKGSKYIEEITKIKVFGFDKTGTLTEGRLKVYDNIPFGISETKNLSIIASLESQSEHPIAQAIVLEAKNQRIPLLEIKNFELIKGKGVRGQINQKIYEVGSVKFFKELGYENSETIIDEITKVGKTPILLGSNKKLLGILSVRDSLRISAPILLKGLKKRNYESMILSGDTQNTVDSIGEILSINLRYGNLLPNQKLEKIKTLQKEIGPVSMVGDGINDAPAIATSNVGIAMGVSGSDIALQTADLVIMNDDLTKILVFLDIAKKSNNIIKQNIIISITVKISMAILTIFGLMTLMLAVGIGDMGVSLFALFNSLRLFRYKSKFQELSEEDFDVSAKYLYCKKCKLYQTYPQHHGREMIKSEERLICWQKLAAEIKEDECFEKFELKCQQCNEELEMKLNAL